MPFSSTTNQLKHIVGKTQKIRQEDLQFVREELKDDTVLRY